MKADELMIGDWVCTEHDTIPRQIDWIRTGEVGLLWNKVVTPPYLVPIPITPEILKKSGWKHDPSVQRVMINTNYQRNNYLSMYWDSKSHILKMSARRDCDINIPCEYVHELQHALRLCGINKEIVV